MNIQYKILEFKDMIKWFIKHDNLRLDFEALMRIHKNNPKYNLGTLIQDNLESKYKVGLVGKLILLVHENKIIGSCVSELETNDNIYISNVFINPDHRGKKLCQIMVTKLIESYDNTPTFILDVNKNNIGAIKCYEHVGFKIKEEKSYFKDGTKQFYYIMHK